MAAKPKNDFAENQANYIAWTQQSVEVYTNGDYWDILQQRRKDVKFAYLRFLFQGSAFQIFAMFLLGLWAGRKDVSTPIDGMHDAILRLWFFGFYGRWGPAAGLALAAIVVSAQVVGSNLWFQRHRYGPAEWLWRRLTYKGTFTTTTIS
jgi:uncharacterized membrane protein YeiB